MQKSKSSSSVMQQASLAKKIFRSRSKSQTRPAQTPCSWVNRVSFDLTLLFVNSIDFHILFNIKQFKLEDLFVLKHKRSVCLIV